MKKDVIIVGGGPSAIITALTARNVVPDKTICLIKSIGDGVIPCAIPYMMNTMPDPKQNILGNAPLEQAGVEVMVDTVTVFDPKTHTVQLASGGSMDYEKLVLATGTDCVLPPIPGVDKDGVHTITKSLSAMTALRERIAGARNVAIIGGGFIGVEFADELSRGSLDSVHLIEIQPKLTAQAFDDEYCDEIEEILKDSGVHVHTGRRVTSIDGGERVESVTLENGETIPAEVVLVGIGARPATELAKNAGLPLDENGSIKVDDYMRTEAEDVFAVGDCAQKRDFFTRRPVPIWLASTATAEARIAGTNLYKIRIVRQIPGTIAAFSTKVGERCFASAGMICRTCERENFRCINSVVSAPDRHPGTLPGASPMKLKLIFADRSGILLGGQISGGPSVGELINVIALAIQKKVTARELDMMQIATHPMLTAAPTVHPLVNAAHQALARMRADYRKQGA